MQGALREDAAKNRQLVLPMLRIRRAWCSLWRLGAADFSGRPILAGSASTRQGKSLFYDTSGGRIYAYREGNRLAARGGPFFILGGILLLCLFGVFQPLLHKLIDRKTGGAPKERRMRFQKRFALLERIFNGAGRCSRPGFWRTDKSPAMRCSS
jgi:hypothetical protein